MHFHVTFKILDCGTCCASQPVVANVAISDLLFFLHMPYYNFEENTKRYQLEVWQPAITVRIVLQKLDKLSFHNSRDEI